MYFTITLFYSFFSNHVHFLFVFCNVVAFIIVLVRLEFYLSSKNMISLLSVGDIVTFKMCRLHFVVLSYLKNECFLMISILNAHSVF